MFRSKTNKNYLLIGAGVMVLIFLIYGLFRFFNQPVKLPSEFLKARQEAAALSQNIVDLTSKTHQLIKETNASELAGRSAEALKLITEARQINKNAYNKAFDLSLAVQKLAESLIKINSARGRQLAYEAASLELALISEFISYTQELDKFLESLGTAIITNSDNDRRKVAQNLTIVNQKISTINNLNKNFLAKMVELDSL